MTVLEIRREDLDWRQVDEDIVILDGRNASYLTLNGSGALLWRRLAQGSTRDGLVDLLLGTYDVDRLTATADTDLFLKALCERGFLAE